MATILLADDSESIRALVAGALREAGHEVVSAPDGRAALRHLRARSFDLVISDIYMPDADGIEVITAVSRLKPRPPVIAMSSSSGAVPMLQAARVLGASVTLEKPFQLLVLLHHVATLLATKPAP